jgi:peroxiredoxin
VLKIGDKAPSLALKSVDDRAVSLAELWQAQHVILVFLRHLG